MGMAPERLDHEALHLSDEVLDIIKEVRRPVTRRTYAYTWKRFYLWCIERSLDPTSCALQSILENCLGLATDGLMVSSINVPLCEISWYRKRLGSTFLSSLSTVQDFIKGLMRKFPPVRRPTPNWNIHLVLGVLMKPSFESIDKCPLKILSWKAIFLVAITPARRVSEMHAFCADPAFTTLHETKVVLRSNPRFLPKVIYHLVS